MNPTINYPPVWLWLALMGLTALSPANTKVAGAAGLLWVTWAGWQWLAVRRTRQASSWPPELLVASRAWWWACLLALAIKAIPQLAWNDPWGERHFLLRTMLMSVATWWLLPWVVIGQHRRHHILAALSVAGAVGLWVAARHLIGHETPTNRINWAVSLSFLACLLVPWLRAQGLTPPWRWLLSMGTLCLLMAILISGVRGAYPVVLWCAGVWLATGQAKDKHPGPTKHLLRRWGLAGASVAALAWAVGTFYPNSYTVPAQRLQQVVQEAQRFLSHEDASVVDSSVGVRLFMWEKSLPAIADSPLWGHGREGRMLLLRQWADETGSATLGSLGHLHNEYIHAMIDHGLLGLLSLLCQMLGLVWVAWLLRRVQPRAAWGMAGIAFIHMVASLSNVNTAHNYYGAMLGWTVTLAFLLALPTEPAKHAGKVAAT